MFIGNIEVTERQIETARQEVVKYFTDLNDYYMALAEQSTDATEIETFIRNAGNAQNSAMDALYAPDEQFVPWYIELSSESDAEESPAPIVERPSLVQKIISFIAGLFSFDMDWQTSVSVECA